MRDGSNENPSDTFILAPLITACVFVTSSMLSNVVSDYKESEKIPAELVGYFQTLLTFAIAASRYAKSHRMKHPQQYLDEKPVHLGEAEALRHIESMLLSIVDFLDERRTYLEISQSQIGAEIAYISIMRDWEIHTLETPEHVLTELRKKLCRMHDIARTHIILPLYTLIDVLTVCLISYILTIKFTYESTAYASITFFGGIFIYLNFLNRDLDDPFVYPPGFHLATYLRGAPDSLKIEEAWTNPPAIDFNCLTVDFGTQLRKAMNDVNLKPSRINMGIETLRTEEGSKSLGALQRQFSFLRTSLRITGNPLSTLSLDHLHQNHHHTESNSNKKGIIDLQDNTIHEGQMMAKVLTHDSELENIEEVDEQGDIATENFYGKVNDGASNEDGTTRDFVETWEPMTSRVTSLRFSGGQTLS